MKKYSEMNKHEKAAFRAIKEEFNWTVGGWYNSFQDGYEEDIPELQEAKDEVYNEVMRTHPKELRFAGEDFCREVIDRLFAKDIEAGELWGENGVVTNRTNTSVQEDEEMKMDEAKTIVMENIKGACEHFFKAWAEDDELKPATTEEVKDLLWEESTSNAWTPDYTDGQIDEAIQTVDMNWVMDIVDELVETLKKNKEDETMAKINEREEARTHIRNNYTAKEMREQLKEAGITVTSKMKKDELVEMMLDLEEKGADRKDKKTKINKVNMYAFTGMLIGEFDAEVQDGKILVYTERKGELMFDLNTGKELTEESKARYANRVEAV